MKNLKISTRLSGAFALLVLMLVGLAVAAMAQLAAMRAATVEISEIWLPSVEVVNAIDTQTAELRSIALNHIMNTDDAAIAKIDQRSSQPGKDGAVAQKFEALISSPEEKSCTTNLPAIGPNTSRSTTRRWPIHAKRERPSARPIVWKVNLPLYAITKRFWTNSSR